MQQQTICKLFAVKDQLRQSNERKDLKLSKFLFCLRKRKRKENNEQHACGFYGESKSMMCFFILLNFVNFHNFNRTTKNSKSRNLCTNLN